MASAYGAAYGAVYGTPTLPKGGQGIPKGGGGRDGGGSGRLRHAIRKAFLECEEALLEWEEAHRHSLSVIEAIVNATLRLGDFKAAEGDLGVLSSTPGAERLLTVRLVQSVERLLAALHVTSKMFEASCVRVEKAYEGIVKEQVELQVLCSLGDMWQADYPAQPTVGAMLEWLQDLVNALRREAALRQTLVSAVGFENDKGLLRAADLWDAGVFYQRDVFCVRLDTVKVHCIL